MTTDPELLAALHAIRDEVRALRLAVERGREDPGDAKLLQAIAATIGDRVFTCAALLQHAALPTAPDLRAAVGSLNTNRIGKLLSRIEGRSIDGLSVHRVGTASHSACWMVKGV